MDYWKSSGKEPIIALTDGLSRWVALEIQQRTDEILKIIEEIILGAKLSGNIAIQDILEELRQEIMALSEENKRDSLKKMRNLVPKLEDFLIQGKFDNLGKLLNENWLLKKSLVETVSSPEIDDMYEKAINAGALGGKLCGAGGGGFLLLYVPKNKQDAVRSSLKDYRELPFMLDSFGSRILFNVRSYSIK